MITIIHGTDTAASRKYFFDQKERSSDALLLDGEKVNITDLAQIFEGGGLFEESKNIFIEQLLVKKKKNSDFKTILAYLEKYSEANTIFLWENKELERSAQNALKNASLKVFKLPQNLFLFLDSIKPGNGQVLLQLFHKTIETTEIEMVFFMLIRQMRILLALSQTRHSRLQNQDNQDSEQVTDPGARMTETEIDEIKKMAPWQRSKLAKQASLFSQQQLLFLYNKLFTIEQGQKTGTLTTPLVPTIDFLLLEV